MTKLPKHIIKQNLKLLQYQQETQQERVTLFQESHYACWLQECS